MEMLGIGWRSLHCHPMGLLDPSGVQVPPFLSAGQDMATGTCLTFLSVCSGGPGLTLSRRATVEDRTQVQATEASQCYVAKGVRSSSTSSILRAVNVLDWSSEKQGGSCVAVSLGVAMFPGIQDLQEVAGQWVSYRETQRVRSQWARSQQNEVNVRSVQDDRRS